MDVRRFLEGWVAVHVRIVAKEREHAEAERLASTCLQAAPLHGVELEELKTFFANVTSDGNILTYMLQAIRDINWVRIQRSFGNG